MDEFHMAMAKKTLFSLLRLQFCWPKLAPSTTNEKGK